MEAKLFAAVFEHNKNMLPCHRDRTKAFRILRMTNTHTEEMITKYDN
jgi:hypothetical protein